MAIKVDESTTVIRSRGGKGKPRPLRGKALLEKAHQVLLAWSNHSPKTHSINISTLSKDLNVSRQTLYDNGLDKEIPRYKDAQRKNFSSDQSAPNQKSPEQRIAELEKEKKDLLQIIDGWIERWAGVEYNARMLGIDPDEIFAPLPGPQRSGTPSSSGRRGPRRR